VAADLAGANIVNASGIGTVSGWRGSLGSRSAAIRQPRSSRGSIVAPLPIQVWLEVGDQRARPQTTSDRA
jgi:hypothetical protein